MSHSEGPSSIWKRSLKRRQFLANLLFAGGAVSVAGIQASFAEGQRPVEEGWDLPDDLLEPTDPPKPPPQPQPRPPRPDPQPDGGMRVPQPRGEVQPPKLQGSVMVPPPTGEGPTPRK